MYNSDVSSAVSMEIKRTLRTKLPSSLLMQNSAEKLFAVWEAMPVRHYYRPGQDRHCVQGK